MANLEQKNGEFINLDASGLRQRLVDERIVLAIPDTTIRVRVVDAQPFSRAEVGKRYKDWGIEELDAADLWNPWNRTWQSLVITQEEDRVGGCVRLVAAEYWDTLTERFVDKVVTGGVEFRQTREGDIAKFLGLQPFERSRLRFLDESNTLYIVRDGQIYNRKKMPVIDVSPQKANTQLGRLLE